MWPFELCISSYSSQYPRPSNTVFIIYPTLTLSVKFSAFPHLLAGCCSLPYCHSAHIHQRSVYSSAASCKSFISQNAHFADQWLQTKGHFAIENLSCVFIRLSNVNYFIIQFMLVYISDRNNYFNIVYLFALWVSVRKAGVVVRLNIWNIFTTRKWRLQ
jgi:hypothetical protein